MPRAPEKLTLRVVLGIPLSRARAISSLWPRRWCQRRKGATSAIRGMSFVDGIFGSFFVIDDLLSQCQFDSGDPATLSY
jgi:hypothetical protein